MSISRETQINRQYRTVDLKDYICEAISHGTNRKYIPSNAIPELETIIEKDMVSLLESLTFKNFKRMNPGKDYGYLKDSFDALRSNSGINYLFNYVRSNFKRGDIVWHWFEKSSTIVIVVLDKISLGSDNSESAVFQIQFAHKNNNDGHIVAIYPYSGKETNTAIGTKTIYLERAKTNFDGSVKALKNTLSKYE
jgi:hypothetical protein